MRFLRHLTEGNDNPKNIIANGLSLFYKDIPEKVISNDRMVGILDYVWGSNNFEFGVSSEPSTKKFIVGAYFMTCGEILIELSSKNNLSQYLLDNPEIHHNWKKNIFIKEFHLALSHEYQHKKQWDENRFKQVKSCEKYEDYLSDPIEMEAYAKEAAVESINYRTSKPDAVLLYREYFKSNHPVYKKFIKLYNDFRKVNTK